MQSAVAPARSRHGVKQNEAPTLGNGNGSGNGNGNANGHDKKGAGSASLPVE
jgi:hypothetical protein